MRGAVAPLLTLALAVGFLALCLASVDCGSGACQQAPCVPGVPALSQTCRCVPTDGGPALEAGDF
jgi:hypothetical protein